MFNFLCRASFLHGRQTVSASQSCKLLYILRSDPSISKPLGSIKFVSTTSKKESFTVSYLVNKCGFSQESASWALKLVQFGTPEKPDSFIAFLKRHGFSKTQIQNLIRRDPELLVFDVEKTLLPKLKFFYSIGFSKPDLAKLLTNYPTLLRRSLAKQIIPSFNFLRELFQSDDGAIIKAIKRFTGILVHNIDSNLLPNMNTLRRHGVPESYILTMLQRQPRTLMFNAARFEEIVEEVKRMGFDSSSKKFVLATFILRSMTNSTLQKKIDVFKQWGWSDQDVLEAFQKHPTSISVSVEKFMAIMEFLVNKMGFSSGLIAKQPSILCLSLEKRIMPRALFAQDLLSLGLIKDFKLSVLFNTSEKSFLKMFVHCHVNKAPELLKLYEEKFIISGKMKSKLK